MRYAQERESLARPGLDALADILTDIRCAIRDGATDPRLLQYAQEQATAAERKLQGLRDTAKRYAEAQARDKSNPALAALRRACAQGEPIRGYPADPSQREGAEA